ncbi:hypothetical protein CR513_30836, partial [Mucuna pruriens]
MLDYHQFYKSLGISNSIPRYQSSEPFIVYIDASMMCLSDALMLKDLAPKQFKTRSGELSYHELELGTLVDESRFEDFSDHKSLRHLLKKKFEKETTNLRDSTIVCEVTLKSRKLGILNVTSNLMEGRREGWKLGLYLLDR